MTGPIFVWKNTSEGSPDLHIEAGTPIPELDYSGPGWEQVSRERFDDQAGMIFDALVASLPGGTIDALLVRMLDHKRTLFHVKH